jgi:hypothetical protein
MENPILPAEFQRMLEAERSRFKIPRSNTLPDSSVTRIIEQVKEKYSYSTLYEAKTAIAVIFQQGGTSRSCDGNMTINVYDKDVKLAEIRKIIKDSGHSRGERKLARSMASEIQAICVLLEIPGNLFLKISRLNPDMTFDKTEQAWLSDFQALNDDTPPKLKALISESFEQRKISNPGSQRKSGK